MSIYIPICKYPMKWCYEDGIRFMEHEKRKPRLAVPEVVTVVVITI